MNILTNTDWRKEHGKVISAFLIYLNKCTDEYILKGGTSLMTCYGLDRFSEDIDLDCSHSVLIKKIVKDFCDKNGYEYRIAKDTTTVKRFMINYGNSSKPLKIEISYRKKYIDKNSFTKINGITVYNIDDICRMKSNAYSSRDRIRDLYDLTFICNNYWESLSVGTINGIADCVAYKGIEQFDYLIKTQSDELIDNDKLAEDFLNMYDKLGLLISDEEQQLLPQNQYQSQLDDIQTDDFKYVKIELEQMKDLQLAQIDFEARPADDGKIIVKYNASDKEKVEKLLAAPPSSGLKLK